MSARADWYDANRTHLLAGVARVRAALERQTDAEASGSGAEPAASGHDPPFALDTLVQRFGLSGFERDVLLLAAGPELDAAFQSVLAAARADGRAAVTFGLALAVLPDAHWSALTPAAPLRRWRLVELEPAATIVDSPLRIDERILHFLAGTPHPDERLRGVLHAVDEQPHALDRRATHDALLERWLDHAGDALPLLALHGADAELRRWTALELARALRTRLLALDTDALRSPAHERSDTLRLVQRECALDGAVLLIELRDTALDDAAAAALAELTVPVVIAGARAAVVPGRRVVPSEVAPLSRDERRAAWRSALGDAATRLNGALERIADQFRLGPAHIHAVAASLVTEPDPAEADAALWALCRAGARPKLDTLAQRIDAGVTWDDLVLPPTQLETLRTIALHVRHRVLVHETWGLADRSGRGHGISALFTGPSGTGKTMAAEVLANELRLDLYRIDLSQVVSKYIGETEKNLGRVFDAAEGSSAILLFDEADALFGRRSEVKDSHDRYANIEVSYLLQRMESYRGLAVLTTNLASAIDPAFLRRLRFSVAFPFPDEAARREIWRRTFPTAAPTRDLDPQRLARLSVAGGNIRNIALHAAFFAAADDEAITMAHVLRGARVEYAKLERALTAAEAGGWT